MRPWPLTTTGHPTTYERWSALTDLYHRSGHRDRLDTASSFRATLWMGMAKIAENRLKSRGPSPPQVRFTNTSAPGHFGTYIWYRTLRHRCRCVLGPKCPGAEVSRHHNYPKLQGLGAGLTQCGVGQELPLYQKWTRSVKSFGDNQQ